MSLQDRIFTADVALYLLDESTFNNFNQDVISLIGVFTECTVRLDRTMGKSTAARDIMDPSIVGFGRNVGLRQGWSVDLGTVVDGSLDVSNLIIAALTGPSAAPYPDATEIHRGLVKVKITRRGNNADPFPGDGDGASVKHITYTGLGYLTTASIHLEENANTQRGTITGAFELTIEN